MEISVKPDGFIHFHEKEEGARGYARYFFLEVDRSSEVQEILVTRAACYFDHYKSGGFTSPAFAYSVKVLEPVVRAYHNGIILSRFVA